MALLILIIMILAWPWITRWVRALIARKLEDAVRKAAGMPPRQKGNKASSAGDFGRNHDRRSEYYGYTRGRKGRPVYDDGPIIPKEYAEDVEFVEDKELSRTSVGSEASDGRRRERYEESQVSDAVWEMVEPGKKRK